jgi:hypothetical protein
MTNCINHFGGKSWCLLACLLTVHSIRAQTTFTRDGGGADNNIGTAQNWVGDVAPTANTRFTTPITGEMTVSRLSAHDQRINAILLNQAANLTLAGGGSGMLTQGGLRTSVNGSGVLADRSVTFAQNFMTANGATNFTYFIGLSSRLRQRVRRWVI